MFDTIFDDENYHDYYSQQIMRNEIDKKYNGLIPGLDKNDPTYEGRKGWNQAIKEKGLDSIQYLEARLQKNGKKKKLSRYRC